MNAFDSWMVKIYGFVVSWPNSNSDDNSMVKMDFRIPKPILLETFTTKV
jgi:hypothetical protein